MDERQIEWGRAAALVILVVLVFLPATQAGFIWDDDLSVTQNPALRSVAGLKDLWITPGTTTQYYPLLFTTFWLEYAAWGLSPFGYHLNNILLHAVCALLLWRVLGRLQVPGAWFAAAVFAVHPVQVETVAWVYERKNILSLAFALAALWAWLRFFWEETAEDSERRLSGYGATLGLYVCALLTKVTMVVFAPSLLVIAWWKRGRITRGDLLATLPMLVLAVPIGLLTRSLESGLGETLGFAWQPSPAERVLQIGRSLFFYLGQLVWPHELAFVYRRWEIDASDPAQWVYPLAALGLTGALWRARARIGRGPLTAWLLFCGALAPMLGLLEVYFFRFSYVADHWQYVACIGPIALGVGLVARYARTRDPLIARMALGLGCALVVALGVSSWRYTHVFRSSESIWRDSLSKNPDALLARYNLAVELQSRGQLVEAMRHYQAAARLSPDNVLIWSNMGLVRAREGRLQEALALYDKALALDPDHPITHWNKGLVLEARGDFDAALPHLERAFRIDFPHPSEHIRLIVSHTELGNLLLAHERPEEAAAHYRQSLEHQPDYLPARLGLARASLARGDTNGAIRQLEWVLRLVPDHPEARALLERANALRAEQAAATEEG